MIKNMLSLAMLCAVGFMAVPAQAGSVQIERGSKAEVVSIEQRPHVGAQGLAISDEALLRLAEQPSQHGMQLAAGPHGYHGGYHGHPGHGHPRHGHAHHHHNHPSFRVNYYPAYPAYRVYPSYPSYSYYRYQPYYQSGLSFSFGF